MKQDEEEFQNSFLPEEIYPSRIQQVALEYFLSMWENLNRKFPEKFF